MSGKAGSDTPYNAFTSAFPGALPGMNPEAWQNMWSMFMPPAPGSAPAAMPPSLSLMSEMIAPLTSLAGLDKRIVDLRAVEHWLKVNLQMLQSTTQALEVQRATLATLRAFGVMGQPATAEEPAAASAPEAASVAALDPAVWWGVINDQFRQLAAAAAGGTPGPAAPGAAAPGAAAPAPESKPGSRKSGRKSGDK